MRPLPTRRPSSEAGFSLVELLVAIGIITVLVAIAIITFTGTKDNGRANVSSARLAEAQTVLQRARDREQMTVREIIGGAGSFSACAQDPLPRVAELGGGCLAAWQAVNTRLAPFLGSAEAAATLLTDASGRPILINAVEQGCAGGVDTITSVHPSGARTKAPQQVTMARSGYGC